MPTPKTQVLWKIEVRDKNGKLVSTKQGKSKSFVLGFLQLVQAQSYPAANPSIKDILNASNNYAANSATLNAGGPITNANYGIVVGTGNTAVANTDYKLQTQIAHGVGAGQLSYGAESITAAQVVGANVDLLHVRTFQNLSGGTITINEIGMYAIGIDTSVATHYVCILHDLVTQAVANLLTATVTYTFRTTA